MKTIAAIFCLVACSSMANAQSPDPSKWMCRNVAESGGFVYQGESVFGTQACRPIAVAAATAPTPRQETTSAVSISTPTTVAYMAPSASIPNSASSDSTAPASLAPTPIPSKVNDGKVRLYVTDEPKDESIFLASHRSGWQVNGSPNGYVSGSGGSAGAAYGHSEKGADPRTVEVQADLYKSCPSIVVTNDPARADYALLLRREGGKRSSMFMFGGLTGLALSAHMKVDGASVFDVSGDMVFATRARTVENTIKEVCGHLK